MDFRTNINKRDAERYAAQMVSQGQYWLAQQATAYVNTGVFSRPLVPDYALHFATRRIRKQMGDHGHVHNDKVLAAAILSTVLAVPTTKFRATKNAERRPGSKNVWRSQR